MNDEERVTAETESYERSWPLAESSSRFDSYAWMRALAVALFFALRAAATEPMGCCPLALSNCWRRSI